MARKVRLRIRYERHTRLASLLALALLVVLFLPALARARQGVTAPHAGAGTAQASPRSYYLTKGFYNGAQAPTACASGYHFASLWEIRDPSNLRYDTQLGLTRADSGQGPPTSFSFGGWVRTGYNNSVSGVPGTGNCDNWTSLSSADLGTYARLPSDWTVAPDMGAWKVDTAPCTESLLRVWCVADRDSFSVYLPLVVRVP
jgi:hypothetical protein